MTDSVQTVFDSLKDKQEEVARLTKNLSDGVLIRKAYGLAKDLKVVIQRVQPSGISSKDTANHIVRLKLPDGTVIEDKAPEFARKLAQAINNE